MTDEFEFISLDDVESEKKKITNKQVYNFTKESLENGLSDYPYCYPLESMIFDYGTDTGVKRICDWLISNRKEILNLDQNNFNKVIEYIGKHINYDDMPARITDIKMHCKLNF